VFTLLQFKVHKQTSCALNSRMRPQFSHALTRRLLVRKANKQENLGICVFSGILSKDLCALDIICEAGCLSAWLVILCGNGASTRSVVQRIRAKIYICPTTGSENIIDLCRGGYQEQAPPTCYAAYDFSMRCQLALDYNISK
jgi:hypothetical protein